MLGLLCLLLRLLLLLRGNYASTTRERHTKTGLPSGLVLRLLLKLLLDLLGLLLIGVIVEWLRVDGEGINVF